jgi:hydrophobic/amphiphilic exporter-1 (mainly G- bacteria), HAE1 family
MFSNFFIKRPVFAGVISILIVLLGGVAYFVLPIAQYPELAPPVIRVEALYPGANAQTVAETVASVIEQEVNGVDNMLYMQSTSSDGRYGLEISFESGADVDLAQVLVNNRVTIASPRLPEEVRRLGVTVRKQSTNLVGVLALYSPNRSLDDIFLTNYLALNVRDEVARIPGVGAVNILPAKDYGMRVWLDPEALQNRNLTVSEVNNAIREQNVQVAAGALGQSPAPQNTAFQITLNTTGRLTTPEQFKNIIVKQDGQGGTVLLGDVARVELGSRDYSTRSTFNGQPNAVLIVYQLPGANLVAVADELNKVAARVKSQIDAQYNATIASGAAKNIDTQFFYDSSMFIRASLEEVFKTLLEAFILVALVVLVFLQSWRATLIPLITIPVSLIGTFLVMYALGYSVNMLTMFGLVLAIGIVVDDAIVVVENVERNLALTGLSPPEATSKAMAEIFGPVIAITLVLMSVFLPTAALPGITGEMYRQFALTIAAATFFSAINALTLAPALCAALLKPHATHEHKKSALSFLKLPAKWFNDAVDLVTLAYGQFARLTCVLAPLSILVFAGVIAATYFAINRVPTGFVPEEDLGFVVVAANLPPGSSLERSSAIIDQISPLIREVPGVSNVVALSGFSVLDGNNSAVGNCWIVLDPWDVRVKKGQSINSIIGQIYGKIGHIQDSNFLVFSLPAIPGLGNASGVDVRLQDRRGQSDMIAARSSQNTVLGEVLLSGNTQYRGKILFAFSSFRVGVPQMFLDIDRDKVKRLGVSLASVFETLQTFLGSSYINDFSAFGRSFQVNVQADSQYRQTAQQIDQLQVRNSSGAMVPLRSIMTSRDFFGPDQINRYNMYPAATVNVIPAPGTSTGQTMDIFRGIFSQLDVAAAGEASTSGFTYDFSGMSKQQEIAAQRANPVLIFGLAMLMVYLILAAQYESWLTPLAVVFSVPLVVIGAALALQFRGLDNNVFTQIGLVLLVGLGAKNAILIVEFARENIASGKGIVDSAVEAATTRFRPIVMTSFAFILGVVPLLIATGAGAGSRRSLGTAVFGGMLGATILGLIFTPMLFVVIEWFRQTVFRIKPKQHVVSVN